MRAVINDPFRAADDPALPSLAAALDPAEIEDQFNRRLDTLTDGGRTRIRADAASVIRHKPGRRCVVEYGLSLVRGDQGPEQVSVIGKIRANRFGNDGFRRLLAIRELGFDDRAADRISVPQPLGTIPRFRMWLQRKVPGQVATRLLGGADRVAIARRVAETAYKFHQIQIPVRSRHTLANERRILRECMPAVQNRHPEWRNRLAAILEGGEELAAEAAEDRECLIHRDFYSDQLIVEGQRVCLLDLDLCCIGDPALDIGNFVGHVMEYSLRTTGDAASLRDAGQAIIDRYAELSGETVRQPIEVYTTLTLVRHIYLSTLFPPRRQWTASLIELCEKRIEQALDGVSNT